MSFQVSKSAARKPHLSAQAPTTGRIAELTRAVIPLDDKAGYIAEIAKLWVEAQDRFLTIGRYLVIARRTLKHGEFEAMIARELPFAKATAHQLRTVAEAVDEGRFRRRNCRVVTQRSITSPRCHPASSNWRASAAWSALKRLDRLS